MIWHLNWIKLNRIEVETKKKHKQTKNTLNCTRKCAGMCRYIVIVIMRTWIEVKYTKNTKKRTKTAHKNETKKHTPKKKTLPKKQLVLLSRSKPKKRLQKLTLKDMGFRSDPVDKIKKWKRQKKNLHSSSSYQKKRKKKSAPPSPNNNNKKLQRHNKLPSVAKLFSYKNKIFSRDHAYLTIHSINTISNTPRFHVSATLQKEQRTPVCYQPKKKKMLSKHTSVCWPEFSPIRFQRNFSNTFLRNFFQGFFELFLRKFPPKFFPEIFSRSSPRKGSPRSFSTFFSGIVTPRSFLLWYHAMPPSLPIALLWACLSLSCQGCKNTQTSALESNVKSERFRA